MSKPTFISPVPENTDISTAERGAEMLGLDLKPQMVEVAQVLEAKDEAGAPLYDDVTVQLARRSAKTTSIQMVLLGRCEKIKRYRILQTAHDGTRASEVFMEMVKMLEDVTPDEDDRNWIVYRSTGREYIHWTTTGAEWRVVAPRGGSYRSKAADVLWFDESGEMEPEASETLEAAALPVMDTRDDGQVIRSGTPGLVRDGTFWKGLEVAREKPDEYGIVDYHAPDNSVIDLGIGDPEETWELLVPLLLEHHPGLANGLTTLKRMRKRFDKMDTPKFLREYLCVWPPDTTVTALNMTNWEATEDEPLPAPPNVPWAIGFDVSIGATTGAISTGWFDENDDPWMQLVEHKLGVTWMVNELFTAVKKHPKTIIFYDNIGDNIAVAQALMRMPRFKARNLQALQLKQVAGATAVIAQANDALTLHHGRSKNLDAGVKNAAWREAGGSRLFRRLDGKDVSTLLSGTHALAGAATLKRTKRLELPKAAT